MNGKKGTKQAFALAARPVVAVNVAEFRLSTAAIVSGTFTLAKSVRRQAGCR
jgi:hypothetical protein